MLSTAATRAHYTRVTSGSVTTSEGFRRKDSNLRKRNQKTRIPGFRAGPCRVVRRGRLRPEREQRGTGANAKHLVLVGGTDRDRLALRSVAAAALGMLDVGDIESATALLRRFLG